MEDLDGGLVSGLLVLAALAESGSFGRAASRLGKTLNLTHQQIAEDLNSSREVISRLLKKMEKNGMLTLGRNAIEWLG